VTNTIEIQLKSSYKKKWKFKNVGPFLFQIFAEGGAYRLPLAVSSSIEATPTSGVYRVDH
jgi:hypothetical protein